jgi:hypothetical protein
VNYSVVWVPSAEQELAAVWLAAPDRPAVSAAAHRIDQRLGTAAPSQWSKADLEAR